MFFFQVENSAFVNLFSYFSKTKTPILIGGGKSDVYAMIDYQQVQFSPDLDINPDLEIELFWINFIFRKK